jgi:hypothetical protein
MSAEHASPGISAEFAFAQQVLCRVLQTVTVSVGVFIFRSAITGFTLSILSLATIALRGQLRQVNPHAHGVTSTCPFISGCGPQLYG